MSTPNRQSTRKCPVCLLEKTFAARNVTCSLECGQKYRQERMQKASSRPAVPVAPRSDESVLVALKDGALSLVELADRIDMSPRKVSEAVDRLRGAGHLVEIRQDAKLGMTSDVRPGAEEPLIVHNVQSYSGGFRTFGLTGDNHLGSKHERLDVLTALYDLYASEGVTEVLNTGNWIEGEARFNKHDIKVFGMDRQIDYMIENYPRRHGMTTYFVAGDDHEGWYQQREQVEIGRYLEMRARRAGREDLVYKGYVEADIELKAAEGSCWLKLMHPGGGSAYALSYAAQKIVESLQGGEKPSVLIYGHYHKFDYNYAREVHCIGTGCTVDQSVFMRKNKIQAHVGGLMLRLHQAPAGHINRCQVEWLPFYDRDFYRRREYIGRA